MQSLTLAALVAAVASAQNVPPPDPILLTTTKSAVLPTLPTPFNGVDTLQGAIIKKGPVVPGYVGQLGTAAVQSNQPAATYTAELPPIPFNGLTGTVIRGTISGAATQGQTGVTFTINLSGLPDTSVYGPFPYHIHDSPVPRDGNCTSTLAHFDLTNRGEYYPCDTANTSTCQTGDLSGKHGTIRGPTFTASYVDNFVSTDPSSPYFFGAKSIVIHTSNTTRLTCANFVVSSNSTGGGAGGAGGNATATGSSPSATSSTPAQFTGAASKMTAGGAVLGLAAAFAMML